MQFSVCFHGVGNIYVTGALADPRKATLEHAGFNLLKPTGGYTFHKV